MKRLVPLALIFIPGFALANIIIPFAATFGGIMVYSFPIAILIEAIVFWVLWKLLGLVISLRRVIGIVSVANVATVIIGGVTITLFMGGVAHLDAVGNLLLVAAAFGFEQCPVKEQSSGGQKKKKWPKK
jgi:hypothetical protein